MVSETSKKILGAIKKHLEERPDGMSRRKDIRYYVVETENIISDKVFKDYFRKLDK